MTLKATEVTAAAPEIILYQEVGIVKEDYRISNQLQCRHIPFPPNLPYTNYVATKILSHLD